MGKKWKKKYKQLKKDYDRLLCDNIRLSAESDILKNATDEQLLAAKNALVKFGKDFAKASEQLKNNISK